jgi:hypothetical protein
LKAIGESQSLLTTSVKGPVSLEGVYAGIKMPDTTELKINETK